MAGIIGVLSFYRQAVALAVFRGLPIFFGMSISKIIGSLALSFSLMPWLGFRIFEIDSQPWSLMFFIIYIIIEGYDANVMSIYFVLVAVGCIISLIKSFDPIGFPVVRGLLSYSTFILSFTGASIYIKKYSISRNIVIAVNLIWILVSLIEIKYPEFKELLVVRRTTEDRGLTALAPEPTYFAIYLFFTSWILLVIDAYRFKSGLFVHIINCLAIMILAKSALGMMFLVMAAVVFLSLRVVRFGFVIDRNILTTILFICFALISVYIYYKFQSVETRLEKKTMDLLSNLSIYDLFYFDASMNERLESLVFSLHGSFLNSFLPAGFDSVNQHRDYLLSHYEGYFWYSDGSPRIMSWIGEWVYTLGFIGILFITILFRLTISGFNRISYGGFFQSILLFTILISAIPIATSFVSVLFALIINSNDLGNRLSQDKKSPARNR